MITVHVRIYEELNQFLPSSERKRTVARTFHRGSRLSRLLEALGISLEAIDPDLAWVNNLNRFFCLRSRIE